ncbi:peptidoglycan-binding domain-containing protein [Streptomyces vilmorinianum]|uniref:peptidoglycan-binding domain-containing protein n=1 Tax=Streptomyces vilmorinianum TaxID=3051092 RepID=UPI0010FB5C55|nr:peptidoglycan-binding domain-containing protein [Streptomyces vilmorinianum]
MRIKLGATLGTAALLLTGLGAMAPTAAAADLGAAATWCTTTRVIEKTSTTYIRLPATSSGITCEMAEGSNGTHVRALQNALNHCYSAGISSDGSFGPATESALKAAQRAAGVTADGIYGPNTRDAIKWPRFSDSTHRFTGYCAKR